MNGFEFEKKNDKIRPLMATYYLENDKIQKSSRSSASGSVYVKRARVKWFD